MRIGFVVARIGGEDGVALEVDKWIDVLDRLGHEVFILSGNYERCLLEYYGAVHRLVPRKRQAHVPLMSFSAPEILAEQRLAFLEPDGNEEYLLALIDSNTEMLTQEIVSWIKKNEIDVLISENANALPLHLSLGIAIRNALAETGIKGIAHDHDFFWERGKRYVSPYESVHERMAGAYPLNLPNVKHAVINTPAKDKLLEKYGRESEVFPNVMDFNVPFGIRDGHNMHFLPDLGLDPEKDVPLLQVTRIVRRKGIEVAVELLARLKDPRYKLIITGDKSDTGLEGDDYIEFLNAKIAEHAVGDRVLFAGKHIETKRGVLPDGNRLYELSDVYAQGRGCCYFSWYEGFGNAFVEAVCAKQPIFVNNYQPVYWPEIGSKGFKTVQLEDNKLSDEAVEEIRSILEDDAVRSEMVEHNFELGRSLFSYDVLGTQLESAFAA